MNFEKAWCQARYYWKYKSRWDMVPKGQIIATWCSWCNWSARRKVTRHSDKISLRSQVNRMFIISCIPTYDLWILSLPHFPNPTRPQFNLMQCISAKHLLSIYYEKGSVPDTVREQKWVICFTVNWLGGCVCVCENRYYTQTDLFKRHLETQNLRTGRTHGVF